MVGEKAVEGRAVLVQVIVYQCGQSGRTGDSIHSPVGVAVGVRLELIA